MKKFSMNRYNTISLYLAIFQGGVIRYERYCVFFNDLIVFYLTSVNFVSNKKFLLIYLLDRPGWLYWVLNPARRQISGN